MHIHSNDPHSFYQAGQPKIELISWVVTPDFSEKRLSCMARIFFDRPGNTALDTRDLRILKVTDTDLVGIPFELGSPDPLLGSRLSFDVPEKRVVEIRYETSPDAHGIQWMSSELAGGKPFVYTQGEAINARTYIPCQDTPSVKFKFGATLVVPTDLRGLIAASEHVGRTQTESCAVEEWNMPFPITSYLIAFAVGDLVSEELSDRSRVWAQPHMLEKAANEFRDIPKLMAAGERLFGEYPFGRYDVLVMPDAFPYGGMENPCLSFLTPALVAGDGSGISTVAHELAHSWTGNLVTNANWDSFWLNEGWTVWAEDRIVEEVYGADVAMLGRKLLELEFQDDLRHFEKAGEWRFTALCPDTAGIDPDDVFSRVPYFKGAQLLTLLEQTVGRERFDAFALRYIDAFKYQSIDTETFLDFLQTELGQEVFDQVRVEEWVYGPGYPKNAPEIRSSLIGPVEELARKGEVPPPNVDWIMPQWQLYLELLPRDLSLDFIDRLEGSFRLSTEENTEVRWSFLVLATKTGYLPVFSEVERFLLAKGRMKYLKPLYAALGETPEGRAYAEIIFANARHSYHPVAVRAVENALAA